jgi:hypothetical protein
MHIHVERSLWVMARWACAALVAAAAFVLILGQLAPAAAG